MRPPIIKNHDEVSVGDGDVTIFVSNVVLQKGLVEVNIWFHSSGYEAVGRNVDTKTHNILGFDLQIGLSVQE